MRIKELESVSILGLGLLGGSVGLAVNRSFPGIYRIGYSHRQVTRDKALQAGVVDVVYPSVAQAVAKARLVILASPISVFADLMRQMIGPLPEDCLVTDVGSTKVLPMRRAEKIFRRKITFIGSHPMAGSEQQGVEFARADLFDGAHCIITPTAKTPRCAVKFLTDFAFLADTYFKQSNKNANPQKQRTAIERFTSCLESGTTEFVIISLSLQYPFEIIMDANMIESISERIANIFIY